VTSLALKIETLKHQYKMEAQNKKQETIDITPTWEQILPVMLQLIKHKDSKVSKPIEKEFLRMAQIADSYVAHVKKQAEKIKQRGNGNK
jgi:argininosuccinate lyase